MGSLNIDPFDLLDLWTLPPKFSAKLLLFFLIFTCAHCLFSLFPKLSLIISLFPVLSVFRFLFRNLSKIPSSSFSSHPLSSLPLRPFPPDCIRLSLASIRRIFMCGIFLFRPLFRMLSGCHLRLLVRNLIPVVLFGSIALCPLWGFVHSCRMLSGFCFVPYPGYYPVFSLRLFCRILSGFPKTNNAPLSFNGGASIHLRPFHDSNPTPEWVISERFVCG